MYEQVSLNLLRKFDPFALSPLIRDRAYYPFFKRVLDVTVAALALVVLSPVLALIAVLIVLDSPGPIIFAQKRVGARRWTRDGFSYWQQISFTCYKFRSMFRDADQSVHQAFTNAFIHNDHKNMAALQGEDIQIRKLVHDPRVTRLGRFLRRSSLDELPQLWNVLKGDMSLVGPRPPIPYEVDEYEPWHRRRLETKPGLTGLWQVTARSSADFDEAVRLDIEYIERQSLWLDLKILLKTPLAVLSSKGAV
jgi:lipopolysaccharide/colanic/teichoic acid biosynthesis glycosyltransferase